MNIQAGIIPGLAGYLKGNAEKSGFSHPVRPRAEGWRGSGAGERREVRFSLAERIPGGASGRALIDPGRHGLLGGDSGNEPVPDADEKDGAHDDESDGHDVSFLL
jgi:hypothetical protein